MLEIVAREAWRARPATWIYPCTQHRGHVVYTCFGKDFQKTKYEAMSFLRWMQFYCMWFLEYHDIRYNFILGEDGTVYEGHGWTELPYLPDDFRHLEGNALLLGIIGPFKVKKLPPMIGQSMDNLIKYGVKNKYMEKTVRFHAVENNKDKDKALLELDLPDF